MNYFANDFKDIIKKLEEHNKYIREFGIDMPEILNWNWND